MSAEKNIYTHLHLHGNELRGFVFERLESDPDPIDGSIYYNVAKNEFRACISGVWVNIFSIWHIDDDGNITTDKQVIIKNNLISEDDTSSGGEGEDTPSGGISGVKVNGVTYYDDNGDGIVDLGTISGGGGTADLSNYYTKSQSDARYLALSGGGQVVGSTDTPLYLKSGVSDSYIGFRNSSDTTLGYYGFRGTTPIVYSGASSAYYLIHSGNIGSYNAGGIAICEKINTQEALDAFNDAQNLRFVGVGSVLPSPIAASDGIVISIPWYNTTFGAQIAIDDQSNVMLLRTRNLGVWNPWYQFITAKDDGYVYGLGGMIDIQYTDEINRYGGNLYIQHRGTVAGEGTGGNYTGHIIMCANGGNVGVGAYDPQYKWHLVNGSNAGYDIFSKNTINNASFGVGQYGLFVDIPDLNNNIIELFRAGSKVFSVKGNGDATISGALVPSSSNTSRIGGFNNFFSTSYINVISCGAKDNNLWLVGGNAVSTTGIQFARNADGSTSGRIGTWDATGLYPATDNAYTLGTYEYLWSSVWSHNGKFINVNTIEYYRTSLASAGWKKVAIDNKNLTSSNVIINIKRIYNNTNNETYTFLVNCAYNGQTTITQIGGNANSRAISQIAVYNPPAPYDRAIYIYYNTSAANDVIVNCIGDFDAIKPEAATLPSSNVKTMNTTSTGFATTGDAVIYGDVASA